MLHGCTCSASSSHRQARKTSSSSSPILTRVRCCLPSARHAVPLAETSPLASFHPGTVMSRRLSVLQCAPKLSARQETTWSSQPVLRGQQRLVQHHDRDNPKGEAGVAHEGV